MYSRLSITFKINKSAADLKRSKFIPFSNRKTEVKMELGSLIKSQQKYSMTP